MSFSQTIDIVNPTSKASYKLPDLATVQSAVDVKSAIVTDETAAQAVAADATIQITKSKTAEAELGKATAMSANYTTGINNFAKNDVAKYTADLNSYSADGTKYNAALAVYNKAALASNALPAKDRKPASVADLTKQKAQIDAWGLKLTQWKTKLDAAVAKLDVQKAALEKQKQQSDAANLAATNKLKVIAGKLKTFSEQLAICSGYHEKARTVLTGKFNEVNMPDTGYFSTPDYKNTATNLATILVHLKQFPGVIQ